MHRLVKITVYQDHEGLWRWQAKRRNGRTVGASEEGFARRYYAKRKALEAFPDGTVVDPPAR